jgi:hypothetical protein
VKNEKEKPGERAVTLLLFPRKRDEREPLVAVSGRLQEARVRE